MGTIHQVESRNGRLDRSGFSIDVQAKATINWSLRGDTVVYDLEVKNYNDIVARFSKRRATPLILVVLCLPCDEADWLTITANELTLKNCCYWCQLTSEPTANKRSSRIEIPVSNLLTPDVVVRLLAKAEAGEVLS